MKNDRYANAVQQFHQFILESSGATDKHFATIKPQLNQYLEKREDRKMKIYEKGQLKLSIDTGNGGMMGAMSDADAQKIADVHFSEIGKYSITPTTFRSRTLEKHFGNQFVEKIQVVQKKLHGTQVLLKARIDQIIQPLEQDVNANLITEAKKQELVGKNERYVVYKNRETELIQFQQKLNEYDQFELPNFSIFVDGYSNNSNNTVTRYGLNSSLLVDTVTLYNKMLPKSLAASQKSGRSNKEEVPKTLLHQLEMILVNEAIRSLTDEKKVVLIDIFARDDKEQIKFDKTTKSPETHTVVLYKNNDSTIVVIDPSNSTFSKPFASEISNLLVSGELMNQTLKSSINEIKIYTPTKAVGPSPEQSRDCIDIAVKIAFGLNKHVNDINPAKISELLLVQEISNNKVINEGFLVDYNVARIRQASEDNVRCTAEKIMDKLYQQRKSVSQYKDSEETAYKILHSNINSFNKSYNADQYNNGLHDLLNTLNENQIIINQFEQQNIDLIGADLDPMDQ